MLPSMVRSPVDRLSPWSEPTFSGAQKNVFEEGPFAEALIQINGSLAAFCPGKHPVTWGYDVSSKGILNAP